MATRRYNTAVALAPTAPAPTELAVQAALPELVLAQPPDVKELMRRYYLEVGTWAGFQVSDDATYVKAAQGFTEVGAYLDSVENMFDKPCGIAHRAWKAMTDLRGMFKNPAELIKSNLAAQQLSWKARKDAERRAEEDRLRREAEDKARRDREAQRRQLEEEQEAERQRQLTLQEELPPWEQEEVPEAAPVTLESIPAIEVAEVRLPSTVPAVAGVASRRLPWAAQVTDFKALVIWIGKQASEGDDRWLSVLLPDMVKLNQMSKEHTTALKEILPGVEAFQGEGLARR